MQPNDGSAAPNVDVEVRGGDSNAQVESAARAHDPLPPFVIGDPTVCDIRRTPPAPLPDIMYDRRTRIELARDEFAEGRLTLAEFEHHVEEAIRRGE